MHPGARGKRDQAARHKIVAACNTLVNDLGLPLFALDGFKQQNKKDPLIDAMLQREATATFLELVVEYLTVQKDAMRKQVEYETREKIKEEQYKATMPSKVEPVRRGPGRPRKTTG